MCDMAGTTVHAVYMDLRLRTGEVEKAFSGVKEKLKQTQGAFSGVSGKISQVFSREMFSPVLSVFGEAVQGMNPLREGLLGLGRQFSDLIVGVRGFGNNFRESINSAGSVADRFGRNLSLVSRGISSGWGEMGEGLLAGWSGVWKGITGSFGGFVNRIIGGLNSMISGINRISLDIPSWLGGGRLGFNVPKIPSVPALARGGIVSAPTLALVGERGREAVLPLENNTGWMVEMANMLVDAMGSNHGGGVSRVVVELDGKKLAEALVDDLGDEYARRGR